MKKAFFDECAEKWDCLSQDKAQKIENFIIPLLEIQKEEKILDACCGTGVLIPLLKKSGAKITCYDYSEKMLNKAKEIHGDDCDFIEGKVEETPFENEYFDKIICHNAFPHIEDKQKFFLESFRILKTGGIFVVSHDCGKKEVDEFHKKCNHAVKNDMMPSNSHIIRLAASANFINVEIADESEYFAIICKK